MIVIGAMGEMGQEKSSWEAFSESTRILNFAKQH